MDTVESLRELKELLDLGILSQDEYEIEKAKLVPTVEISVDDNMTTSPVDKSDVTSNQERTVASELIEIKSLYDNDLITSEEYTRMRSDVLSNQVSVETSSMVKMPKVSINTVTNAMNKKIMMIGGGILAAVLVFVLIGFTTQTTQEKLSKQVATAVTDKDSKKLLATFSPENQKVVWALPGVSELMNNWRGTNTTQIVNKLAYGENINTIDDHADVKVTVQHKPHMYFWKTYYLEVQPINIKAKSGEENFVHLTGNKDDQDLSRLDDNAKKEAEKPVSVKDLENKGAFPGWWIFEIKDKSGNRLYDDSYIRSYGQDSDAIVMGFK